MTPETGSLFQEDKSYLKKVVTEGFPISFEKYNYSITLPDSARPGHSEVYRHPLCKDKLFSKMHPNLDTVYALFENSLALWPENDFIGRRLFNNTNPDTFDTFYTWESYTKVAERRTNVGAGIFHALRTNRFITGAHNMENFIVSLFSGNTPEWVITDLACAAYSIGNTALYDTLGPGTSEHILGLTESPIVVCSNDKLEGLLGIKKNLPFLIQVVAQQPLAASEKVYVTKFAEAGVQLHTFEEIEALGASNPMAHRKPHPETLYTISFTSGTTGNPKGVVLKHRHAVSSITWAMSTFPLPKGKAREYIFLPVSHIFERGVWGTYFSTGTACAFPQSSSPTSLVDDLLVMRPTSLISVPRVFTRFEALLKDKTINSAPGVSQKLSSYIIDKRAQWIKKGCTGHSHWLFDRLLTNKLRDSLGLTNARYFITGSAPISPQTINFFKAALNVGFAQGYGMTESFSGFCLSDPFEIDSGSCGPIGITTEARLRDVPEMGYTSQDKGGPRGEVLLRGPQMFEEYYKNPEETAKAFDEDGWYRSGDVGRIDEKGHLFIIDRVKNFFKLAQGEYVTPERIENQYLSSCPYISQLYVHGDSLQTYLVAIVGIDPLAMAKFLESEFGISAGNPSSPDPEEILRLLSEVRVKRKLLVTMNEAVSSLKLQGFEKIHNIYCDVEPLTVSRDVVTPTFKIKRPIARKFFAQTFEDLYSEGSLIKDAKL
ncbi:hypothetical protein BABINDRAFT_8874 [Babjeviella inositovora NRRL Y-12698]|uniref:AMP-dependent synthetase/ligase domain-containing protein n=1 Tax=Babjeviella inositovora NRRL Y-12698 TaxID=984486 RepID=A0A1E3QNN9_9ASCO|nr:uncharacterized protein BABINDRAFT_8874 [Babjeviella inositovora NRRL Y-12698]ODQ79303.1 hypothetical protein BABINDRAFT_8874 [Babjeviella inositovora NRRL Y-12698]